MQFFGKMYPMYGDVSSSVFLCVVISCGAFQISNLDWVSVKRCQKTNNNFLWKNRLKDTFLFGANLFIITLNIITNSSVDRILCRWLSMVSANERRDYVCNLLSHWLRPCLAVDRKQVLTLNMQGPSYLSLTWSISWLLMPWLLTSPGHQQPWYWLCRICRFWSYLRKDFKYLCHINVE